MPTITPPLLSPGHWTSLCRPLCDPPSVPRSTIDPSRHKAACRMPPGRPEYPATQPRSLMPPPWLAPPNPGSVATVYRAFAVSRASGPTDIGVRDSVPQPHKAAISSTYARDRMGSSLSTSLAQVLQEVTIMRGAAAPRAPDPDIKSRGVIRGPNPACPRKRSSGRLSVPMLAPDICQRAMRARDPRFDGVFFVGITTTGVYCRPVCPSRVARPSHRRFFESAALAERAGFRPCLRCRPELAPGRSQMDAVPRLARAAAQRIAAASGFRSLRRFNSVFRERYGLSPSALRPRGVGRREYETVRLTLAYRPPFAWDVLIALLAREALPGVEVVRDGRYARTVRLAGERGVVFVAAGPAGANHLAVDVSPALLPALMTLLARLRHLFDLDAEPTVVDAHLAQGGLAALVERRPGVRLPGALDGFEAALRALLHGSRARARRVVDALGEPHDTGTPGLTRLSPGAERVAEAGAERLAALGVPRRRATGLVAVARAVAEGSVRLEPGGDVEAARRALRQMPGVDDRIEAAIVSRALDWPDAFPASDRSLQHAAGAARATDLESRAEQWRPWRAYAALHLWLHDTEKGTNGQQAYRKRALR